MITKQKQLTGYSYELAAVLAMYKTAEKLQPSGSNLILKNEQKANLP
ncbi:hypothetical protein KXD93_08965 [Mucilaginibacter sp. BJC16-A38]|nr:hypothetical protein [Mucilaginibacter phenanthrenivorans]MCR8557770.1 hypothetical protein [Mucilaginibacter phenanthrenivorans]